MGFDQFEFNFAIEHEHDENKEDFEVVVKVTSSFDATDTHPDIESVFIHDGKNTGVDITSIIEFFNTYAMEDIEDQVNLRALERLIEIRHEVA